MKAHFLLAVSSVLLMFCLACSRQEVMQKMTPAADEVAARTYITEVRSRNFDQLERDFSPDVSEPGLHDKLIQVADMLPSGDPRSSKIVGILFSKHNGVRYTSLSFENEYSGQYLLIEVTLRKGDGSTTLAGLHITPLSQSLEEQNAFTLVGKGPAQYLVLTFALASVGFSFYAFVFCWRTNGLKRKWLWLGFTLFGAGQFVANWTTGQLSFTPVSFHVPPAGVSAMGYGPWNVLVSFPLGALIFLSRRKRLGEPIQSPETSPKSSASSDSDS